MARKESTDALTGGATPIARVPLDTKVVAVSPGDTKGLTPSRRIRLGRNKKS